MPTNWIIAIAALVLVAAVVLMVRELGQGKKASSAPPEQAQAKKKSAAASKPPIHSAVDHEDEDVTKVGVVPPKALPTLAVNGDEEEKVASESRALVIFEENAEIDEPTGPESLILVSAVGKTDRGLKRRKNEDSHLISRDHSLYVVADGMGGYGGGDVASRIAVETILRAFEKNEFHVSGNGDGAPKKAREFVSAIESANALIFAEATRNSELHGMGTTVIGARFSERKQRVFIAHVGDSRCYRWRHGELRLLTVDHTLAARGVQGPMADHIRRAVGIAPQVKVDLLVDKPLPGDVYVLCSDGLTKMVDDAAVAKVLSTHSDLDDAVADLIKAANEAGGKDNTTVILVGVNDPHMIRPDGRKAEPVSIRA